MRFVKRPVAIFCLCAFISFCIFAVRGGGWIFSIVLSVLSALLVILCAFFGKKKVGYFFKIALLASLGITVSAIWSYKCFDLDLASLDRYLGEHEISGVVTAVNSSSGSYSTYFVDTVTVDGEDAKLTLLLGTYSRATLGDTFDGTVTIEEFDRGGSFDERNYYLSKDAVFSAECSSLTLTGKSDDIGIRIKLFNSKLCRILKRSLSEDAAAVSEAVFLGNKNDMSTSMKEDFSRIGISHLVAISGMHVSFIAAAFSFVMSRLGFGKKVIMICQVPLMIFYMALCGFSASVVRAAVLAVAMSLMCVFGLCYDGITSLGVCGFLMLAVKPNFAFDLGMQLSFSAYAGCLAAVRFLKISGIVEKLKKGTYLFTVPADILSSVIFTVVTSVFTLPVAFLNFDITSIAAPLVNLIFIPMFSILMYLAILVILLSPIPTVSTVISFVCDRYITFVLSLSERLAGSGSTSVSLKYPFSEVIVILLAAVTVILVLTKKKTVRIISASLMAVLIAFYGVGASAWSGDHDGKTVIIRTGSEDGEMITLVCDGVTVAVDCGGGETADYYDCVTELRNRCIIDPDAVVFTKYGPSSKDLFDGVVAKSRGETLYFAKPGVGETTFFEQMRRAAEEHGLEWQVFDPAEGSVTVENITLTVEYRKHTRSPSVITFETAYRDVVFLSNNRSGSVIPSSFSGKSTTYLFAATEGKKPVSTDELALLPIGSEKVFFTEDPRVSEFFIGAEVLPPDGIFVKEYQGDR